MRLRGLYAIVDTGALAAAGLEPIAFAREILEARPTALQLRAKKESPTEISALAGALAPLCREANVPFVLNDHIELAIAAGCDLVHLGQDDESIELARKQGSKLAVGLSTHTPEQLVRALAYRPAYVAYGPIFQTASKRDASPVVGLEGLAHAHRLIAESEAPETPLVAIGGISLENVERVGELADAGAVIGALVGHDARALARALQSKLGAPR